jgi:hypothetical protein
LPDIPIIIPTVSSSTSSISTCHKQLITNNETLNFKERDESPTICSWWPNFSCLMPYSQNNSWINQIALHYYFSYVPKFEACNIFFNFIGVYTKIFIHLSLHFQHIVLINFLLLIHLKNSPMNYSTIYLFLLFTFSWCFFTCSYFEYFK